MPAGAPICCASVTNDPKVVPSWERSSRYFSADHLQGRLLLPFSVGFWLSGVRREYFLAGSCAGLPFRISLYGRFFIERGCSPPELSAGAGDGFGLFIAINCVTVTNLYPLAIKPSKVAGIASTVCLCISCDRMIAPGRTWLKMRCVITEAPGRFQSKGSTDHRMILKPNWL